MNINKEKGGTKGNKNPVHQLDDEINNLHGWKFSTCVNTPVYGYCGITGPAQHTFSLYCGGHLPFLIAGRAWTPTLGFPESLLGCSTWISRRSGNLRSGNEAGSCWRHVGCLSSRRVFVFFPKSFVVLPPSSPPMHDETSSSGATSESAVRSHEESSQLAEVKSVSKMLGFKSAATNELRQNERFSTCIEFRQHQRLFKSLTHQICFKHTYQTTFYFTWVIHSVSFFLFTLKCFDEFEYIYVCVQHNATTTFCFDVWHVYSIKINQSSDEQRSFQYICDFECMKNSWNSIIDAKSSRTSNVMYGLFSRYVLF